jgi:hypothetical protein
MPVGILEVAPAAAVAPVDLAAMRAAGVGPEVEAALADAIEDRVELRLADEEGIVLWCDLVVGRVEVERDVVVDADDVEGTETRGRRPAEDLGEERGRARLVAAPDDRVIQRTLMQAECIGPRCSVHARRLAPSPSSP